MKRLATKAICSVGVILGVVFGIDSNLATSEQGLSNYKRTCGDDGLLSKAFHGLCAIY